MGPRKIIIDTDPGVDDVLAMLLAFSALPEELEVLLLSVTYGNVGVQDCLRNVVSLFSHIEKELRWRSAQGRPLGFDVLRKNKPLVAVGPTNPLTDQILMADFFHGLDGLGNIDKSHPHMTPAETWKDLFSDPKNARNVSSIEDTSGIQNSENLFVPSKRPAHEEILRLLRENEKDTITIVAIGPLTNLALAAAQDPEVFLRSKEIVVMGGALKEHGNVGHNLPSHSSASEEIPEPPFRLIKQAPGPLRDMLNNRNQITPVAEFNTFADSIAAARVYALSSPQPASTMPPVPPAPPGTQQGQSPPPFLLPYPAKLSRRLKITLFPLDITNYHRLSRGKFRTTTEPLLSSGSPLAEWVTAFLSSTFAKIESLQKNVSGDAVGLQLHDPMCIWYSMDGDLSKWTWEDDQDIRIETSGQWTRGMCVVDRRTRKKRPEGDDGERPGDTGNWLSVASGNRLRQCISSPGSDVFEDLLLRRIFGL